MRASGLIRTVSAGEVVFLPRGNVRRFRNPGIQPAASRLQIYLQEQSLTGGFLHLP
jgi:mannose-6-phosphate isomerase-like protein (cupin superfamily)